MSNVPSGSALQGGTDAYGIVLQPQGTGQLYFGKVFLKEPGSNWEGTEQLQIEVKKWQVEIQTTR